LRTFETEQANLAATTRQAAERQEMKRGNRRQIILLVEDEIHRCGLTIATLQEPGYAFIHAHYAIAASSPFDARPKIELMFIDIGTPIMNEHKVAAEAIRRQPRLQVLIIAGFTRHAVVYGGVLDAGVDLIAKPFTSEKLAAKVG